MSGTTNAEGESGRVGLRFDSVQIDPNTLIRLEGRFENDEIAVVLLPGVEVSFLELEIGTGEFSEFNFRIENEDDVLRDEQMVVPEPGTGLMVLVELAIMDVRRRPRGQHLERGLLRERVYP